MCEKSDGIRYLLYLTEDEENREAAYLIDRKNDYYWVNQGNLHFPLKEDVQAFHTRTLIDGELVEEETKTPGRKVLKFLIFDCLVLDGQDLMSRTLDKRLAYCRENVLKPYKELFKRFPEELEYQPFLVEMKEMQFSYGVEMMFEQVLPSLRHGNDGLIFTCRGSEYKHGTDPHILKWKKASENTIDFRLKLHFPVVEPDEQDVAEGYTQPYVDYDAKPRAELFAYLGGGSNSQANGQQPPPIDRDPRYDSHGELYLDDWEWAELRRYSEMAQDPLDERIVEVYRDEQGRWRMQRFRDDKDEANHISTVRSVLESIRDSVTKQELLDAAKSIKDCWKSRQQQQQQQQAQAHLSSSHHGHHHGSASSSHPHSASSATAGSGGAANPAASSNNSLATAAGGSGNK